MWGFRVQGFARSFGSALKILGFGIWYIYVYVYVWDAESINPKLGTH